MADIIVIPPDWPPLPDNYPSALPRPALVNGLVQFATIPPNFDPNMTDLAFMMVALQLVVDHVRGNETFNVFDWDNVSNDVGRFLWQYVADYCKYYHNPSLYKNGQYGYLWHHVAEKQLGKGGQVIRPAIDAWEWYPITYSNIGEPTVTNRDGGVKLVTGNYNFGMDFSTNHLRYLDMVRLKDWDFAHPVSYAYDWFDKNIEGLAQKLVTALAALIPIIGPAAAYAFNRYYANENQDTQDAINDVLNTGAGIADTANNGVELPNSTIGGVVRNTLAKFGSYVWLLVALVLGTIWAFSMRKKRA